MALNLQSQLIVMRLQSGEELKGGNLLAKPGPWIQGQTLHEGPTREDFWDMKCEQKQLAS